MSKSSRKKIKSIETVPGPAAYQAIPVPSEMTPRQAKVILLACLGNHDGEIGTMIGIGYETVRDEMDKLRDLTGLRRKLALASWALTHFVALSKLGGKLPSTYAGSKPCPSITSTKSSLSRPSRVRAVAAKSGRSSSTPTYRSRTPAAAR